MAVRGFIEETGVMKGRLEACRPDWGLRGHTGAEGFHWGRLKGQAHWGGLGKQTGA